MVSLVLCNMFLNMCVLYYYCKINVHIDLIENSANVPSIRAYI